MDIGSITGVTVGVTSVPFLSSNPRRKHLVISPPSAGRVTISVTNPAVLDQGITIYSGTSPKTLCKHDIGDIITTGWFAIADAAGRLIGVVEQMDPLPDSPVVPSLHERVFNRGETGPISY